MTRRILPELGETTNAVWCEDCPHADLRDGTWVCTEFGPALTWDDDEGDTARLPECRSAELRPETVEEIRGALREVTASRMTYEGEERTVQTLADFERLFGGGG